LLERLALLIAANESYERGEEDLALFTGVALSDSTLRRLVLNPRSRFELLDWYHLKENLYRQPWSERRLRSAETQLWQGRAGELIASLPPQNRLRNFLEKQQTRLVDYEDFQRAGIPIGSGAVESAIKQIGARIKVTGARWKKENVNSALANRLAYLNSKQMQN
jgi:hypothetical protein